MAIERCKKAVILIRAPDHHSCTAQPARRRTPAHAHTLSHRRSQETRALRQQVSNPCQVNRVCKTQPQSKSYRTPKDNPRRTRSRPLGATGHLLLTAGASLCFESAHRCIHPRQRKSSVRHCTASAHPGCLTQTRHAQPNFPSGVNTESSWQSAYRTLALCAALAAQRPNLRNHSLKLKPPFHILGGTKPCICKAAHPIKAELHPNPACSVHKAQQDQHGNPACNPNLANSSG